jgi:Tfp pilus assembly protein PilZ
MSEKRRAKRHPRRLPVRFGEGSLTHSGYVTDVSVGGAFVTTNHLPPLGARVLLEIRTQPERPLFMEATVQRHKVVPPAMRAAVRGGFGARFLTLEEAFSLLLPGVPQDRVLRCAFQSPEQLGRALAEQLRHGGLFLRVERTFERDMEVEVEVHLLFVKQTLRFPAWVVHVTGAQEGQRGVGLLFRDAAAVQAALAPFAPT